MHRVLFGVLTSLTLFFTTAIAIPASGNFTEEFEAAVKKLPRGSLDIPIQWFEMKTVVGWEKMMLVLGYANNQGVCQNMVVMAVEEHSGRKFRCTPAN